MGLAVVNLPFVLKREIKEIKLASYLLFGSLITFILVMIGQLLIRGITINPDKDYMSYLYPQDLPKAVQGMAMIIVGISCQFAYFPVHNNLED